MPSNADPRAFASQLNEVKRSLVNLTSFCHHPQREALSQEWLKATKDDLHACIGTAIESAQKVGEQDTEELLRNALSKALELSALLCERPELSTVRFDLWNSETRRRLVETVDRFAAEVDAKTEQKKKQGRTDGQECDDPVIQELKERDEKAKAWHSRVAEWKREVIEPLDQLRSEWATTWDNAIAALANLIAPENAANRSSLLPNTTEQFRRVGMLVFRLNAIKERGLTWTGAADLGHTGSGDAGLWIYKWVQGCAIDSMLADDPLVHSISARGAAALVRRAWMEPKTVNAFLTDAAERKELTTLPVWLKLLRDVFLPPQGNPEPVAVVKYLVLPEDVPHDEVQVVVNHWTGCRDGYKLLAVASPVSPTAEPMVWTGDMGFPATALLKQQLDDAERLRREQQAHDEREERAHAIYREWQERFDALFQAVYTFGNKEIAAGREVPTEDGYCRLAQRLTAIGQAIEELNSVRFREDGERRGDLIKAWLGNWAVSGVPAFDTACALLLAGCGSGEDFALLLRRVHGDPERRNYVHYMLFLCDRLWSEGKDRIRMPSGDVPHEDWERICSCVGYCPTLKDASAPLDAASETEDGERLFACPGCKSIVRKELRTLSRVVCETCGAWQLATGIGVMPTCGPLEGPEEGDDGSSVQVVTLHQPYWQALPQPTLIQPVSPPARKTQTEYTLGQLLFELIASEDAYQKNEAVAQRQQYPAVAAWWHIQAAGLRWQPDPKRMPGIDKLEVYCDEHFGGSGLTIQAVRKVRALLCSKLSCTPGEADDLSLEGVLCGLEMNSKPKAGPTTTGAGIFIDSQGNITMKGGDATEQGPGASFSIAGGHGGLGGNGGAVSVTGMLGTSDNSVRQLNGQDGGQGRTKNGLEHPNEIHPQSTENTMRQFIAVVGGETATRILAIAHDKSRSADEKMRAIYEMDARALGWKSTRWSDLLGVSDSAIRQTDWWIEARKRLLRPE